MDSVEVSIKYFADFVHVRQQFADSLTLHQKFLQYEEIYICRRQQNQRNVCEDLLGYSHKQAKQKTEESGRCSYLPVLSTLETSFFGTVNYRLNITLMHQ